MMIRLIFLMFSIYLTNVSTLDTEGHRHSPPLKLSVNIKKNNKTIPVQEGAYYAFSDGDQTTMNCIIKCSGSKCDEGHKYSIQFYIHKNHDINKTVTVTAETPGFISRTFTLHRNNTEIVCKARYHPDNGHLASSPARVRLQYVPRPHLAPGREPRFLKPSPPNITPGYFKDTGKNFALFKCTAQKQGIALLSWQQMKGSERIILKTVMPSNHTNADADDVMQDTLNKTLTESDRDTKLFCSARYILEGPSLSSRLLSKIIVLTFNRTVESIPQETGALSLTEWMAIVGAIIITAVTVVIILLSVIFRYRKKVKGYERDEQIRNRSAPVPPPPTENVYDQVYGHGAGLKRPRIRPTEKRH